LPSGDRLSDLDKGEKRERGHQHDEKKKKKIPLFLTAKVRRGLDHVGTVHVALREKVLGQKVNPISRQSKLSARKRRKKERKKSQREKTRGGEITRSHQGRTGDDVDEHGLKVEFPD